MALHFTYKTQHGISELAVPVEKLLIIGYAGRDIAKTEAHIKELEEQLGVPAPARIPTIFHCDTGLLTQRADLTFVGDKTSGEAEYVIILSGGKTYITLGSDHTDRALEADSVLKAKQICMKPIAATLWNYEDIKDHFDDILLTSHQTLNGDEVAYQDGKLGDILPVERILAEVRERVGEMDNCVIYSGTVPLLEGFRYGERFRCAMTDMVLGRKIELSYHIEVAEDNL